MSENDGTLGFLRRWLRLDPGPEWFPVLHADCARYPAHLQMNMRPGRCGAVCVRLIELLADLRAQGIHCTAARSVKFYERNGFIELARPFGSGGASSPCFR